MTTIPRVNHSLRRLLVVLLCVGPVLVGFGPPALTAGGAGMTGGSSALYADAVPLATMPPLPKVGASAATVVDGDTGELLWGKQPHLAFPLPP